MRQCDRVVVVVDIGEYFDVLVLLNFECGCSCTIIKTSKKTKVKTSPAHNERLWILCGLGEGSVCFPLVER